MNTISIGTTSRGKEALWAYECACNKHSLVIGKSGNGKTYAINRIIREVAEKTQIKIIVLDYSQSFLEEELKDNFSSLIANNELKRINVYRNGIACNPVQRRLLFDGKPERAEDTVANITDLLSSTLEFTAPQENAFWKCAFEIFQANPKIGTNGLLNAVIVACEEAIENTSTYRALLNRLQRLASYKMFNENDTSIWQSLPPVTIIDLNMFQGNLQILVAELILNDFFNYQTMQQNDSDDVIIVLDEAQNLSFRKTGIISKLLTEGRKHRIGVWLASQSLSRFTQDARQQLAQANLKLYFGTSPEDRKIISKGLEYPKEYDQVANSLRRGQCYVQGTFLDQGEVKIREAVVNIPPM